MQNRKDWCSHYHTRSDTKFEEVEPLICDPVEDSSVAQEIFNLYRGYNFKEVKCVEEEGNNCDMIQCLVPQSFEHVFPCQCTAIKFPSPLIMPYRMPFLSLCLADLPWKRRVMIIGTNKAACYKQSIKKCRHSQMVAKRGCPGSMNRGHCLQEGIIMLEHRKIHTSFECHHSRCFSSRKRSLVE